MLDYKQTIYKIFQANNLYSLDALYYSSFYIYCIIFKKINSYEEFEKVRLDLVNRYNIFRLLDVKKLDIQTINKLELEISNSNIDMKIYIKDLFKFYINNDNLNNVKEYSKYYNNDKLTDWITNFISPINNNIDIYDGNIKINSYSERITNNKIYGNQSNEQVYELIIFDLYINNKLNLCKQISKHDVLYEDIICKKDNLDHNSFFDLIFYDFSNSQHNIIHANCCTKIKKLKIRGTKYEPLLLQLIMMSLNKNGKALLIVPDILLFGDSTQVIETRKYLIDNFNIKKVCQLDESLLSIKSIKQSILYFENNGITNNITFSKLYSDLHEENIITVDINLLKHNDYSLYYKIYTEKKSNFKELKFVELSTLFDFGEPNNKCLSINKYYKSTGSVKFLIDCGLLTKSSDIYYLVLKNSNNEDYINDFLFYYVENILNNKIDLYIKGKMNQIDTSKILSMNIPILPLETQKSVCNYYKMINTIYDTNLRNINMYNNLINDLFKTIPTNNNIELGKISELILENKNNKLIGIIKNGLSAGTVYLHDKELLNNSYYLNIIDNNYLLEYIFYWLKYNQNKLSELSSLTSQMNLNKSNLLSINIPVIDFNTQKNIISYSKTFYNLIDRYNLELEVLKEKDIMNIITQIHKL